MTDLRTAAQAVDDAYFDDAAPDMQMKIAMTALRAALAADKPAADGLLHDKAHVDTGAVRAAQSVRTPEMSYRPGSLRMDAPEPVPLHPNLPTPTDTFGKPDTIAQWVICPHCKGKSPMRPAEHTAQPVVWMQSDQLHKFVSHACGAQSMLARCSDHQLMSDYKPLFTHPVPIGDLSDQEIDKAWRSVTIDYTAPYDNFRREVARAIIAAAREVK